MVSLAVPLEAPRSRRLMAAVRRHSRRHPTMVAGSVIIAVMALCAAFAAPLTGDPMRISPIDRLQGVSLAQPFGTDMLGRDVFARTIHGGQISLTVGFSVALLTTVIGLAIGLVAGYIRALDGIVMRIMDGLMAIPGILLAIAFMTITSASVGKVIIAITIPEVPRMVRLVRSVVLSLREQPYIEAAVASGSRTVKILWRHVLPNTLAPLIVQATYVCANAIIVEAILSFLGAGTPPEVPSWGNIMAEGRQYFQIAPWIILFPGMFLTLTVLAVNLVGDGLRDSLDPRLARRVRQ